VSRPLLILRPQPGADETAAKARALALHPVVAPLFAVHALAWTPPPAAGVEAVMLTSANAAHHAGGGLMPFLALPCYAVGETTAAAAREAGFPDIRTGASDGGALVAKIASEGVRAVLHPCGRERTVLPDGPVRITAIPVYAAKPVERLPDAAVRALGEGAVALIHSPRAGALLARLVRDERGRAALAAISAAAAAAAGDGWASVAVAERPRDEALLELAVKLCQTDPR
jgi:uroporphyrinogen-III synthase